MAFFVHSLKSLLFLVLRSRAAFAMLWAGLCSCVFNFIMDLEIEQETIEKI